MPQQSKPVPLPAEPSEVDFSFLEMPEPATPPTPPAQTARLSEKLARLGFNFETNLPAEGEVHPALRGPEAAGPNKPAADNAFSEEEPTLMFHPEYYNSAQFQKVVNTLDATFEVTKNAVHPFPNFEVKPESKEKIGNNCLAYCYVRNLLVETWFKAKGQPVPKEELIFPEDFIKEPISKTVTTTTDSPSPSSSKKSKGKGKGKAKAIDTYDEPAPPFPIGLTRRLSRTLSGAGKSSRSLLQGIRGASGATVPSLGSVEDDEAPITPTTTRSSIKTQKSFLSHKSINEGPTEGDKDQDTASPLTTIPINRTLLNTELDNDREAINALVMCRAVLKVINRQLGDFSVAKEVAEEEKRWKYNMERMEEADCKAWESWKKDINAIHTPSYTSRRAAEQTRPKDVFATTKPSDIPMKDRVRIASAFDSEPNRPFINEFANEYIAETAKRIPVPDNDVYQYRAAWAVKFVEWAEDRDKRLQKQRQRAITKEEISRVTKFCARKLRYKLIFEEDPRQFDTVEKQKALWARCSAGEFDPKPGVHRRAPIYGAPEPTLSKVGVVDSYSQPELPKISDETKKTEESEWESELNRMNAKEEQRRRLEAVRASTMAIYEEPQED